MKGALDVHGALLARDVPHEVVRLRRAVVSADDLPAALALDPASCLAVRCYVVDGALVAVLLQCGAVPDPAALLDALGGGSARTATAHEVNAGTDYAAGLVSPVCLPDDVVLLADRAVAEREVVYVPVGEGRVALGIRAQDLLAATGARVLCLSARPLPEVPAAPAAAGPDADVIDLRDPAAARRGSARRPAG